MPHVRLFIVTALFGLTAVFALGRLAMLDPQAPSPRGLAAAWAHGRPFALSDANLADAVTGLELKHRVTRVGWDHSLFALDLQLREEKSAARALGDDLSAVFRFAFAEAGNVRQTLIRVYGETAGRRTLLFYGDPAKRDWTEGRLTELKAAGGEKRFVPGRYALKATPAGERWLRNFAN